MYENDGWDSDLGYGTPVDSEGVRTEEYRGYLITSVVDKYAIGRGGSFEERRAYRVVAPSGYSWRSGLIRLGTEDEYRPLLLSSIDANINAGPRQPKATDVQRDVISRWLFAQESS